MTVEQDRVVPYTTERLIEMTKLVDSLADDGVYGAPPGIPVDVHPDLQPLAQYRIAATLCSPGRHARRPHLCQDRPFPVRHG